LSLNVQGAFSRVQLWQHGSDVLLLQEKRDRSADADIEETPYLALDAELMDAVCLAWVRYRKLDSAA
jgi:hypothetical protein